jgi:O-methyltransferase
MKKIIKFIQLIQLIRNVLRDTAECGVYEGAGSYLICKVNQEQEDEVKKIIELINSKDPLVHFEALRRIGKILLPKYRFKWPQMGWWDDLGFNEYLVKFDEIDGMNTDRRWMLYQLMRLVKNVPGDTAECGVYKGAGSYLICKVNQENELHHRTHHIFDSFEGLSEPSEFDGKYWTKGDLSSPLETVAENLSEFNNVHIHKGWIPQHFSNTEHHNFCFVHIDVDLYQPTLDSIKFFYPRMNENGLILCDDYGFTSCPGATKAIDEFLHDKKEKMVSLSGGGGFLIKGAETSAPL